MNILDFIFPKYCINCKKLDSYLCPNCFSYLAFDTGGICVVCDRASVGGMTHPGCIGKYTIDGVFTGIEYKGIAKKLIYNFKYKPYLSDLKNLLVDLLFEAIIQKEEFIKANDNESGKLKILVSIPLHSSRLKSRGYNQAEILARELSKKLKIKKTDVLERTKITLSQVGLKREDRIKNISGAFGVRKEKKELIEGSLVFLVDDVLTTGSTLLEAANVLKRNGAGKVWGIVLARD